MSASPAVAAPRSFGIPEAVIAALGLLICVVEASFLTDYGPEPVYVANLAIHVAIVVGALVHRRLVVPGFLVTFAGLAALAALVVVSPLNLGVSPVLLAAPYSLWLITRHGPTARWGTAALLLGLVGSFVSPAARMRTPESEAPLLATGMVLVHVLVLVVVHLVAADRRRAEEARQADELRSAAADARAAAQRVRLAAESERTQVAREVHDIVAHSLAVAQVQAATALRIGGEGVQREALTVIRDASKAALADTRALVGMLRDDASTGPVGDLTELPSLVASARAGGLDVTAELPDDLAGWQQRLGAPTRLALVRAVQETLTNGLRHASPRSLSLSLDEDAGDIHLRASNRAIADDHPPGYGLVGLRERVSAAGGTLTVTGRPSGLDAGLPFDFALHLTIPQDQP